LIPLKQSADLAVTDVAASLANDDLRGHQGISEVPGKHTVKTVLFARVAGDKIPVGQMELLISNSVRLSSDLIARGPERPVLMSTWGDALYLVFDLLEEAGRFALKLRVMVEQANWQAVDPSIRVRACISLHTGPLLLSVDPVIRQVMFTGSHVSHSARFGAIVRPGEIWASEAFAAHAAIAQLQKNPLGFKLDPLGQIEFGKGYGRYPAYRLRPE
jgi:hypothetical protein